MFTVLRGIVYFAGILVLTFLEGGLLSYIQHMTLGVELVCCFIVTICLMLLIFAAFAKFLEWVIMQ